MKTLWNSGRLRIVAFLLTVAGLLVGLVFLPTATEAKKLNYPSIEAANAEYCKQTLQMHLTDKRSMADRVTAKILPYGEIEIHITYSGGLEDFIRVKKGYMFHAAYEMDKNGRIVDQYIFIQDENPNSDGYINVCFWEIGSK